MCLPFATTESSDIHTTSQQRIADDVVSNCMHMLLWNTMEYVTACEKNLVSSDSNPGPVLQSRDRDPGRIMQLAVILANSTKTDKTMTT